MPTDTCTDYFPSASKTIKIKNADDDEDDDNTTAESPLLPAFQKDDSQTETNNNHNNNNNNKHSITATTTPTQHISSLRFIVDALNSSTSSNFHKLENQQEEELLLSERQVPRVSFHKRLSAQFLQPLIQQPKAAECRRRSSVPLALKFNGWQGEQPLETTSSIQETSLSNDFFGNTKQSNSYSQFYSQQNSPTHTHTHQYNLYPKDTFERLDSLPPPRFSNKMQTKVDAVGRVTGEWGRWQLRTVLLIFLCKIPASWFMACIIFTAPAPRHGEFFCKPPKTVAEHNQTLWIKVSHPQKEEVEDQEFSIDFCNVYQDAQEHAHNYYQYDKPELEPKVWEEPTSRNANVIPCTQFHHQAEFHSVITQYDLVCSRDILVSVTQFFHLFGVLTGGILANHLLKYFSPRNVMMFGFITQIFCGNLTGHVASYELHVFFRCLSAVCCAQMYTAGGMIMADITGGKYKTYVSTLFEQFWSVGVILLPGVASFFSSWSHLYMAISWPTVILIYLWQWIPDSPRWMIARGRVLDAKKILMQCVEINDTRYSLPHDIDQQLQLQAQTAMDAPPPAGWWSIWKGERAVRHMICVHLVWSIYIVIYYGMLLNIRAFSRDHLEVNTVIAGLSEIVGTFIGLFLILKTTRKWLWSGIFNIVAGFIAYTGWLVPHNIPLDSRVALLMLSAMISKIAISSTLAILTTCTTELVSDEKKKICAFSTICWARFWLLGAPFVGATIVFGQLIPQTAFATLAIVGGLITCLISSPRTIPKSSTSSKESTTNGITTNGHTASLATQNMSHATHLEGIDNKGFTQGPIFTTLKQSYTNLPPQLMPGIWTTKNHEEA